MIRILLMRHGSIGVTEGLIYGRTPGISLSEAGRRQAKAAGRAIRNRYRLGQIVSSPMRRAIETARIVAEPQELEIVIDEGFNELNVGEWMGKSVEELGRLEEWKRYNRIRSLHAPPGGELLLEVQRRSWAALDTICRRNNDNTVLVVTHGDVIRSLLLLFLAAPLDNILRLEIALGSVSEVMLGSGEPCIRVVNETFV